MTAEAYAYLHKFSATSLNHEIRDDVVIENNSNATKGWDDSKLPALQVN